MKAKRASTPDDDETWKEGEVAPTLNAFDNGGDSRATVVTVQEEAAGGDLPPECEDAFGWQEDRLAGTVYEDEVPGLTTSKTYAVAVPEGVDLLNQATTGDVSATLRRDGEGAQGAAIVSAEPLALDTYNQSVTETSGTLDRTTNHGVLTPDLAVRRLTPRECERLMGWPDDWTRYAADGSDRKSVV